MSRLAQKSATLRAPQTVGAIPELPDLSPQLAEIDGGRTNAALQGWWDRVKQRIEFNSGDVSKRFRDIEATFNDGINVVEASIENEAIVRANADSAMAQDIVTLTATVNNGLASLEASIENEALVRANADTAMAQDIVTVEATVNGLSATVSTHTSTLATINNYLEARYTLSVAAGNVVTGMTLYSASGPDTDISSVTFQADRFLIYNGTTGVAAFSVDTGTGAVSINGSLTIANTQVTGLGALATASAVSWATQVSGRPTELTDGRISTAINALGGLVLATAAAPSGSGLFLGSDYLGYYAAGAWKTYMDSAGNFYLGGAGGALQWNGATLTITGSGTFSGTVSAGAGAIGGWTLGANSLSGGNATLSSTGYLALGTSNDVVYLSAADATYRIWIGNVTAGSAAFRVTKAGVMTATGGTFSGSLTSTSGTVGGFTIGANTLSAGSGATYIEMSNTSPVRFLVGALSGKCGLLAAGELDLSNSSAQTVAVLDANNSYGTLTLKDGLTTNVVLHGSNTTPGLTLGGDTSIYRGGSNILQTDDDFYIGTAGLQRWLYFPNGGSIAWGSGGSIDTQLYRSGFASLTVANNLAVSGTLSAGSFNPTNVSAAGYVSCGGGSTSNIRAASGRLYFMAGGVARWFVSDTTGDLVCEASYQIKKLSSDGWTPKLHDGAASIEFQASGTNIYGRINGGAAVLLG